MDFGIPPHEGSPLLPKDDIMQSEENGTCSTNNALTGNAAAEHSHKLTAESGGLKRGLSARQVQMIAIGSLFHMLLKQI